MHRTRAQRIIHILPFVGFDVTILAGLVLWNAFFVYVLLAHDMSDFGTFYSSAVAFLNGQDMYDVPTGTLTRLTGIEGKEFRNMNPPHFHLLLLPLALVPRGVALGVWSIASLLALGGSLRVIMRELGFSLEPWQWRWGMVGLLSFSGTAGVLMSGQLSFLLLLPLTLAWAEARRGRWTCTGAYLGLALSVKIFLLIFVPYLLLQGKFRALFTAGLVSTLCFLIGVLVFGVDAHYAWIEALTVIADWAWIPMTISVFSFLSKIFSPNPVFSFWEIDPSLVRLLWLAITSSIGVLTLICVSSPLGKQRVDRDFSLLFLASQLISPLGWLYYLWFSIGPALACVSVWRQERVHRVMAGDCPAYWWRNCFLLAALPGLVWPLGTLSLFQPSLWATVSIGSIYFWATFFLWAAFVADWYKDGGMGVHLQHLVRNN